MEYLKELEPVVSFALREDIGSGDITASLVPDDQLARATLTCNERAILCGRPWFDEVFRQLDPRVEIEWLAAEGEKLETGALVANLIGPARAILTGERTALNFLQTLSGTATATAQFLDRLPPGLRLKDTRKTLPGLRRAQKYAVRTGGAENHRMGLFDAFLIKENHISACGSIAQAVAQARKTSASLPVEVEVETLAELEEALTAGVDTIMLDDFALTERREAVARVRGRAEIEVSGNLDLAELDADQFRGVDYISLGALTKHCHAIDFSMRVDCLAD